MSFVAAIAAFALGHAQIDPNVVIWRDYKAGSHSSTQDQNIVVINSLAEFERYLRTYGPEGAGNGRDVEWGKEELIAIHVGTRNTGGYAVQVDSIKKVKPNEAQVCWTELTPARGVAVTQSLTSPWTIVRLNRTGTRLTFAGSRREGRLPGGIQIINFPGYDWGCTCCAQCIRAHENRLPWRSLTQGDDAPILYGSTCVMNSPDDYAAYTRNFEMSGLGAPPNIDWDRERLLAIHLGRKFTGGYRILLDHVDIVDERRVNVSYVQVEPTGGAILTGASSGPYVIVRIPRVGSMVTFSKRVLRDTDATRIDSCDCGCDSCRYCRHRG